MTPTPTDDLLHDEVATALRRERDHLAVHPSSASVVRARGRRRQVRRRTAVGALGAVAAVTSVGVAASLRGGDADRVRTAEAPALVDDGGALVPLFAATPYDPATDPADPPGHASQLDVLDAAGERQPWSRWGRDPEWGVGAGIVLADGRRVALAEGGQGTSVAGQQALVELDATGAVTTVHPIDLTQGGDEPDHVSIAGADGDDVDLLVERIGNTIEGTEPATALLTVDLSTDAITEVLDEPGTRSFRTAGDQIVSVRDAVSTTEPCLIDVRDRGALGDVRTVPVTCADGDPLPPMIVLRALDATGRWAAVVRTTMTAGAPDLSLVVVDLEGGTTTEVVTVSGGTPWRDVTWSADGVLRLAMVDDDPQVPAIDVPSPAGGPTVEVVRYQER